MDSEDIVLKSHEMRPKVVYQPVKRETQLVRFKKFIEQKYNLTFKDYWDLHKWTVDNYCDFWECIWTYCDIKTSQPHTHVLKKGAQLHTGEWFVGARMNYAENILTIRDDTTAIKVVDKNDHVENVTFSQLYDEVSVYVEALKSAGVRKGDVVAGYLSQRKEAIFVHLATLSIGAIWAASLAHIGAKGVLSRYSIVKPKVLFTSGNYYLDSTEIQMEQKIRDLVSGLPSLEKVILVPSCMTNGEGTYSSIPKCITLSAFLSDARLQHCDGSAKEIQFEQVPFNHPTNITFTSGTTGKSKGVIHSFGGFLVLLVGYKLYDDLGRGDVVFINSPPGWGIWNIGISSLAVGATALLYDGQPFSESPTRFYDLVDKFNVSVSFLSRAYLDKAVKCCYLPTAEHSLKSLKLLKFAGSVISSHSHEFISQKVKKGLCCGLAYGMTELFSIISAIDYNLPIHSGEIQVMRLGLDIRVVDEHGQSTIGQKGDLVIANPYPSLPIRLTGDVADELLTKVYLKPHAGLWTTGDAGLVNPTTNGIHLFGRSDEDIPTKGGKVWNSEVENILIGFEGISDVVYVPYHTTNTEFKLVLFVTLSDGILFTEQLKKRIKSRIADFMTFGAVPHIIVQAPSFPFNDNGKKMNNLVKKIINKEPVETSSIADPLTTQFFFNIHLDEFLT